ncbi:ATP-grasp domain-containing protein [Streptomyces aquilus]|uniref:ATP-grasp domain-containing protein n=1 Tax=Streptomyces aquilus TaxID=2548456 RepID=UPI00367C63D7
MSAIRILVVEPMSSANGLILAAHQRGFEVVVASHHQGDRTIPETLRAYIDELLVVDTNDEAALTEVVTEAHGRRPLTGILPGFEFYVDSVARLAHRLGLPGLPVETVAALRDKSVMRARAAAAGLRVPRYAEASGLDELLAAAAHVGYPAVLKPAASAGSVHVSRVDDEDGLRRAYDWLVSDTRTDAGRGLDGRVLLEEYVAGPEISVEGYVSDGEVVISALTTKLLGPEPHFVEIGMVVQHETDPETRARIEAYVVDLCRALNLPLGIFHCELRLPEGDPVLIEIGARLAGHRIPHLVELATGTSLTRIMLAHYTGQDPAELGAFTAPRAKTAAIHCFTAQGLDTFHRVAGAEELREAADVLEVSVYYQEGEEIPPAEDFRALLGHVVFAAESHTAALERIEALGREVRVE